VEVEEDGQAGGGGRGRVRPSRRRVLLEGELLRRPQECALAFFLIAASSVARGDFCLASFFPRPSRAGDLGRRGPQRETFSIGRRGLNGPERQSSWRLHSFRRYFPPFPPLADPPLDREKASLIRSNEGKEGKGLSALVLPNYRVRIKKNSPGSAGALSGRNLHPPANERINPSVKEMRSEEEEVLTGERAKKTCANASSSSTKMKMASISSSSCSSSKWRPSCTRSGPSSTRPTSGGRSSGPTSTTTPSTSSGARSSSWKSVKASISAGGNQIKTAASRQISPLRRHPRPERLHHLQDRQEQPIQAELQRGRQEGQRVRRSRPLRASEDECERG